MPRFARTLLHELFETQALLSPEAVATEFRGERLTYRELDARANQLAHHLRTLGVGPDVLVGIAAERAPELVVGLLGILKAGGAYVPLDPDYPPDRLSYMVADTAAPVLLTQAGVEDRLPPTDAIVTRLDADWAGIAKESREKPVELASPESLAYVIYTSGSTGRPKGVMNEHRGICNRLRWMQHEYGLGPSDVVLQKTPFSFDVSVWEFFWPIMTGARLVLAEPGGHKDAGYLARLIQEAGVTVLHFVPSMLQLFLEERGLREACAGVRDVICSGEALSFDLQRRFFERMDARLHNLYGPTEAAVDVTYWPCDPESRDQTVPIGFPVHNTTIRILREDLTPVPEGVEGELFIGGVQVARGYWNRPELTRERFIPDLFNPVPGARLYRTGDLARQRADGAFEFLGRIDHQVKIGGNRIELGEIESVLEEHPTVRQAVVVARTTEVTDVLVAYVVSPSEQTADFSTLRQHLLTKLPGYMVPASLVTLSEFPLTPSGKVDRKALPEPSRSRPEMGQAYVAPRNELERILASRWCEVLGLDRVGVRDPFFELGGTSLQAARFVNKMQEALGEFVYVVTIFDSPTVAEYAAMLERDYPDAVARLLGRSGARSGTSRSRAEAEVEPVTVEDVEELRRSIPVLSPPQRSDREEEEARNRPAIFVLSPPRSGSTLLRVMLAGHPEIFAAAELQLLGFNTLRERRSAFTGKFSLWLEGVLRAVMELRTCDAEEARRIVEEYERKDYSTRRFYGELQAWAGDRVLVDKSPSYATDPGALAKAELDFRDPLYIHLVRHPYAMVRSFERYHMDQVLYLTDHRFSARQLGELIWTISHQNTLEFLKGVPKSRQVRLRFEEMVQRPRAAMEALCATLGLEFHEDLIRPYKDIDKKMTDGLSPESTPMGDTRLLERRAIDPAVADAWMGVDTDNFLGDVTWRVAEELGYGRPASQSPSADKPRSRTVAGGRARLRAQRSRRRGGRRDGSEGDTSC